MKSVVLSSGGIDSTTCLAMAVKEYGVKNVATLSVVYGQRHVKELESSEAVARWYGVQRYVLDLAHVFANCQCPLIAGAKSSVPHGSYAQQQKQKAGVVATYVPFRNGLMLSASASFAMSLFPEDEVCIWIGAHADDAAGNAYPDCSEDFLSEMGMAISIGTDERVSLVAPLSGMNKAQVVKAGLELNAPYHLTWSCYEGGDKPCGQCGTCIDRAEAFRANGVEDPALASEVRR